MAASCLNLQNLVAFWAPFLVLHLGGQDTITAYALEDNELWLRHLFSLIVQAFGAAYLLYQYMIAGAILLIPASILVFVVGILKYGERIWALKCASMSSMQGSLDAKLNDISYLYFRDALRVLLQGPIDNCDSFASYKNIALLAGHVSPFSKRLFVAPRVAFEWRYPRDYLSRGICLQWYFRNGRLMEGQSSLGRSYIGPWISAKHITELIDLELSEIYDLFYTKSAVIHTWYGYNIRAFSFFAIASATIMFILSNREHRFNTADVTVTYVLLIGASVLEFTSIFRVVVSTCKKLWDRFDVAVLVVRWHLRIRLGKRFPSIGQYNMISMSASHPRTGIRWMTAQLIGLEDWWIKVHYSTFIPASSAVVEVIYTEIKRRAELTAMEAKMLNDGIRLGQWSRRRRQSCGELENAREEVCKKGFMMFIVHYHVATDIFVNCCDEDQKKTTGDLPTVVTELSNYMMYLLRVHHDILPTPTVEVIDSWDTDYDGIFNKLLRDLLWIEQERGRRLQDILLSVYEPQMKHGRPQRKDDILYFGCELALKFIRDEAILQHKLVFLAELWVDALLYVADGVTANFHAKELGYGGEFVTFVSVLMAHVGMQKQVLGPSMPLGDDACAVEALKAAVTGHGSQDICEEPDSNCVDVGIF